MDEVCFTYFEDTNFTLIEGNNFFSKYYQDYKNSSAGLGYKLSKLFDDKYFTSVEKLKIMFSDNLFKLKRNKTDSIKDDSIVLTFKNIFQTDFFNETSCKEFKGNMNLLYSVLERGYETGA